MQRELREQQREREQVELDDTDGLDAEAEFAAWRMRELQRIQRVQDAELARRKEREEIERRRALPEEQRLQEDLEHARRTRAEKTRGQQGFMQKYYHKGAFFQVRRTLAHAELTSRTWTSSSATTRSRHLSLIHI